jgi:hypothetical protein
MMRNPANTRRLGRALVFAVALAALLSITLVGCGVIGESYVDLEWYTFYFEPYYTPWFEEFEALHSDRNVRVKFRSIANSATESIYTMIISHSLPDCVTV